MKLIKVQHNAFLFVAECHPLSKEPTNLLSTVNKTQILTLKIKFCESAVFIENNYKQFEYRAIVLLNSFDLHVYAKETNRLR